MVLCSEERKRLKEITIIIFKTAACHRNAHPAGVVLTFDGVHSKRQSLIIHLVPRQRSRVRNAYQF